MGVVYKLKKEIVDFVLQQKKANNKISCRSLSDIVQKEFQIHISKSSINEILKSANLSSPVGRRTSLNKKSTKFKLPSDKINTLFQKHELNNSILKKPKDGHFVQKQEGYILHDAFGIIFIKLAFLEIKCFEIISKLMHSVENCPELLKKNEIWEYIVFKQFFESEEKNWFIEGYKDISSKEIIEQAINNEWILKKEFFIDISEYFLEVSFIKIVLDKGNDLWIDSEMISVWTKPVKRKTRTSLTIFLSDMVKMFIGNVQSVVLYNYFMDNNLKGAQSSIFPNEFKDFVGFFENFPEYHVKKIVLYNQELRELAAFDSFPNVKRNFITAILPCQIDFSVFLKYEKIRKKEEISLKGMAKCLFWEEDIAIFPNEDFQKLGNIRMFLLRELQGKDAFLAIISNIEKKKANARDIITEYFLRWPNFQNNYGLNLVRNSKEIFKAPSSIINSDEEKWGEFGDDLTLSSFLKFLGNHLRRHLQEIYFPSRNEAFINEILATNAISGSFNSEDNSKMVLYVSAKDNLFPVVQYAATRINERNILDKNGNRIVMEVRDRNFI